MKPKRRAYSTLELKSIDEEKRIIVGIASTPTPDRMGDIVEPKGAVFSLPIPLLYQHDSGSPIGNVIAAKATDAGIEITAQIAPTGVADFIDEAWALIKAKLVRGLSIGFQSIESARIKDTWSYHILKWDWFELSAVTIPANIEASIQAIKSIDETSRAALGAKGRSGGRRPPPGAPGSQSRNSKGNSAMKTIAQQIQEAMGRRVEIVARMKELNDACEGDFANLEEADVKEYDDLAVELASTDTNVRRLKSMQVAVAGADEIDVSPPNPNERRAPHVRTSSKTAAKDLPKGTGFTRLAIALMATKGSRWDAIEYAKQQAGWKDTSPSVISILESNAYAPDVQAKAAVGVGDSATVGWAAELVNYQILASEFIDLLRPRTIIGRLPALRRVPFNVKIPRQTSGVSAGWVGEGKPKPAGALAFDTVTLQFNKAAVIVAMSEELVRFSNPSSEALVQNDLIGQITKFLDQQFIDPSIAASGTVSPASITHGQTNNPSTGTTVAQIKADLATMFAVFDNFSPSLEPEAPAFIMRSRTARYLSNLVTANDVPVFPNITANGGSLQGVPVITSGSVPLDTSSDTIIVLIDQNEVLLADDGQVSLDTSREASVQMSDSPSTGATSLVSLWQNNLVGVRAEQFITWKPRRSVGITYLTGVTY